MGLTGKFPRRTVRRSIQIVLLLCVASCNSERDLLSTMPLSELFCSLPKNSTRHFRYIIPFTMCVSQNHHSELKLAKCDLWVEDFDFDAFTADMKRLGDELEKNQGPDDVAHLNKMILWLNIC